MVVNILVKREDEHASEEMLKSLPNCPICGAKAYLQGDTVDGFWFGWSVGCPRYCLNDGIHGHDDNTPERDHFSKHGFETKYTAKRWWINRVKRAIMDGKENILYRSAMAEQMKCQTICPLADNVIFIKTPYRLKHFVSILKPYP